MTKEQMLNGCLKLGDHVYRAQGSPNSRMCIWKVTAIYSYEWDGHKSWRIIIELVRGKYVYNGERVSVGFRRSVNYWTIVKIED